MADLERRHVGGARQRVVHQRAGGELPLAVVDEPLEQCLADALRDRPVDLALDQQPD